jgi:hypothetical protein
MFNANFIITKVNEERREWQIVARWQYNQRGSIGARFSFCGAVVTQAYVLWGLMNERRTPQLSC